MEFQKVVESRRSIRKYDVDKKVTKEQVEECVKAAILAPSWKNSQTARYYAILDDAKREEFLANCLPGFNAKNSAGAALVVTTFVHDRAGFNRETGAPDNECGNGWGYYDLGLNNENFVLKAKDMGLDTLIMGLRDSEKIRTMLEIPETETVVSVIALGYAEQEATMPKRKEPQDILKVF